MTQEGKKDQLSGRFKEAAGALLDDEDMKNEGRMEQVAGDLKEKAGRVIDRVKDAVTGEED